MSAIHATWTPPDENSDNFESVQSIRESVHQLFTKSIETKLTWIPGHVELEPNELSDLAAKHSAESYKHLPTPEYRGLGHIKHLIRKESKLKWQRYWDNTSRHTTLHHHRPHIPTGNYKSFSNKAAESKYIRLITGHNKTHNRMHSIKLRDSPNCDCGTDRQTEEHLLMSCPLHTTSREKMIEMIEKAYRSETRTGQPRRLTANSIMHPSGSIPLKFKITQAVMAFVQDANQCTWIQCLHTGVRCTYEEKHGYWCFNEIAKLMITISAWKFI